MSAPTFLTDSWAVDPQSSCPLFNLAAEIRLIIFNYALSEYDPGTIRHDFRVKHHHDGDPDDDLTETSFCQTDPYHSEAVAAFLSLPFLQDHNQKKWIRPDCISTKRISTSFRRTCRRIYLETRGMVPANTELVQWGHRGPPGQRSLAETFARLAPEQAEGIVRARFYTQMYWLEGHFFGVCAGREHYLRRIQYLRITIRQGDWWHNENGYPLHMNPFRSGYDEMREDMAATADFGRIPTPHGRDVAWEPPLRYGHGQWGMAFSRLPNLKSLTIDFDTTDDQRAELEEIVEWAARVWRFRLVPEVRDDGCTYLSAEGNVVRRMSWRGLACHWFIHCRHCNGANAQGDEESDADSDEDIGGYHPGEDSEAGGNQVNTQGGSQDASGEDAGRERGGAGPCLNCARKERLVARGLGPRIYTWSVTWTPRVGETLALPWSYAWARAPEKSWVE